MIGSRFMPDSLFMSDDTKQSQIWYKESGLNPTILESNKVFIHHHTFQ